MKPTLTLALYPNTHGIAYVLCEDPYTIVDFGIKTIREKEHCRYMKKVFELLTSALPSQVILLDYTNARVPLSKRMQQVISECRKVAENKQVSVVSYSREEINFVFSEFGARNKYEVATTISSWYPQLNSRLPNPRKAWEAESYHMGVFDAFALMLTNEYLND